MDILAPSILSADFCCLGDQIDQVEKAGVKWLHIDVMDGVFVPSISYGMPVIASIRKNSNLFFDVHMMVTEPERYIEAMKKSGADGLTIHAEACSDLKKSLCKIRDYGMRVGVAINPDTPITVLEDVLDLVDMILIMTVNPGFGGQAYIENCTSKVEKIKEIIDKGGKSIDIQVDGGIDCRWLPVAKKAGANIFVAGSAVFSGNIEENVQALKTEMEEDEKCVH